MTQLNNEFSDKFDVLINGYINKIPLGIDTSAVNLAFDEYEKSLFLTKAQTEVVVNLYNGRNAYGLSFETTEEARRYLESLVKTKIYQEEDKVAGDKTSKLSVLYELPEDIAFITMEQVSYNDEQLGCYNGSSATVYPVTQDEYGKIKNNPFRGPTRYKALRLDPGSNRVEIISKYNVGEYLIKYLSKPTPIILEDLPDNLTIDNSKEETECKLNTILHDTILDRAVQLALQSRGISVDK